MPLETPFCLIITSGEPRSSQGSSYGVEVECHFIANLDSSQKSSYLTWPFKVVYSLASVPVSKESSFIESAQEHCDISCNPNIPKAAVDMKRIQMVL